MLPRVHQFATSALLIDELCERIAALAHQSCARRGSFSIVLAGGNTPRILYRRLSKLPADWQCWHIYFSDERCLPARDPDRNDSMAAAAWLDHVAIPDHQIHRVPAGGSAAAAATAYASVLEQVSAFDLVLLGLGEDGHTASLFPGDPQVASGGALAIAVDNAPKPPPTRVSMSPDCLSRAAAVWFMVTGDSKREALEAWLAGAPLPPQSINAPGGIDVFTDICVGCRDARELPRPSVV